MICVDLETTGLLKPGLPPEEQPGIVQFGLVHVDENWKIISSGRNFSVNPEKMIEPEAEKAHGITNEQAMKSPNLSTLFGDIAPQFLGERIWIGFNNQFDKMVLFYQLQRYGLHTNFPWPIMDIDVMKVGGSNFSFQGKRGPKNPNLTELHTYLFGSGFSGAHDAMNDIFATVRCGEEMFNRGLI